MATCRTSESKRKHKDGVVNNLRDLFGSVLHIDIIRSVATECNFDVERSSNVLLEMTNHIEDPGVKKKPKKKSPQNTPRLQVNKSKKTLDIERVVGHIRQGYKVLVILRGLPGSGKSHLAVTITDYTLGPGTNSHHILSTDDFFMQRNGYCFDPNKLQEAHEWNHRRAFQAMSRGLSPVIIDNTNTQMWEMKPYAMMATDYGYIIEILEPDTSWVFNEKELARRNKHGVSRAKISDMLDRYEKNVTPQKLLFAYNLSYKFQKPPQFRLVPPIHTMTYPNQNFDIPKSKSTSAISDNTNINLMEFSEVSSQNNFDNQVTVVNPVDEILMCSDVNSTGILQPNPVSTGNLFPDVENAWGIDEKALQSWDIVTPIECDYQTPKQNVTQEEAKPETKDSSTCIEARDFLNGNEAPSGSVLVAQNRDINQGGTLSTQFAPPKKTMIDKSCMTEEEDEDEETRLKDLMDLFPKVPRGALQELFFKCHRNFHWTVDLLLEDNNLEVAESFVKESTPEVVEIEEAHEVEDEFKEPKVFKRKTISDESLELKKCLESKFDINKEHYSEHVYKVKQTKFGAYPEPQPSTSNPIMSSDSESDDESYNPKNMIEINLGDTLVQQLETLFSGSDDPFPKGFQPVVQMPIALVRQIYTYYIESICQQMEAQNHILERLVKEDEEFAKKLQKEESPPEPVHTLNLNEIMDEQVALNLHKKNIDSWKNLTADNLAAKLTKQKLFNTFPNLDQDALLEIWHAYDYDYNKTVEDLIASVGAENVNGSREGITEPPLSGAILQEMKLAEQDCGNLEEPEVEKPATFYREEANKHLRKREQLYEKARSYFQKGMTEVAMFYSDLATKETKLYDKANHLAAVAFIEEHSKRLQKFDTLDLHYFHVKEAISNLDIFIDRNINLLIGTSKNGQDLFIITGRGKHSEGGRAKIKPAVIARLQKRKIGFVQLNAGLLKIRVQRNSVVTSDIM